MSHIVRGRSLELFFVDGRSDGMLTAEVFNWTGHVLLAPRTQISEALKRDQASRTGVYLLIGEKDNGPYVYIGEGEDVAERIRNHDYKKDWWDKAVLITSNDGNLNKAHVKYLEARLIEQARAAARVTLDNGNTPTRPGLSEAQKANMETFFEHVLMILPALRIDCLENNARPLSLDESARRAKTSDVPIFEINATRHKITAKAKLDNGEFVVEKGSLCKKEWTNSQHQSYCNLHDELRKAGMLQESGPHLVFMENYAFKSPSAAASVVLARTASGPIEWKVAGSKKTYGEWEAEKLNPEQGDAPA